MKKALMIAAFLLCKTFVFSQVLTFNFHPLKELPPGSRFIVTPDEYSSKLDIAPIKSKSFEGGKVLLKDFVNKIFIFKRIEKKAGASRLIFECDGKEYFHEGMLLDSDEEAAKRLAHINNLVYLNDYEEVKKVVDAGTRLYTLRETWDNYPDTSFYYTPVRLTKVEIIPSHLFGPYRIHFSTDHGKPGYFNVFLSATNIIGGNRNAGQLDRYFSLEDPRIKFPHIPQPKWDRIKLGLINIGWTSEECELSWGKPNKINRTTTSSGTSEQWVYSKSYLYFENGILKTIQN